MTNDDSKRYGGFWLVETRGVYLGFIGQKEEEYWYVIINGHTDETVEESEPYATYNRAKEQLQSALSALPDT